MLLKVADLRFLFVFFPLLRFVLQHFFLFLFFQHFFLRLIRLHFLLFFLFFLLSFGRRLVRFFSVDGAVGSENKSFRFKSMVIFKINK